MNKFITILILIVFSTQTVFGNGPNDSSDPKPESSPPPEETQYLQPDALKAFLLRPIPEYQGVNSFFSTIQKDPKAVTYYNSIVSEDPDLKTFAQDGAAFRKAYFGFLEEDFGEDGDFMVTPEKKIVEYARTLPRNDTQKTLIPINQRRATLLAWDDTVLQYNLSDDMSLDQLEQNLHIKKYAAAVEYYYKRQNFYLEQEEKKDALELPPILSLKRRLSEKFTDLRYKNFHQALIHAQEVTGKSTTALFKINGQPFSISLKDIENAKVSFAPPSLGRITGQFIRINNEDALTGAAKTYAVYRIQKFDVDSAQSFYFTQEHGPLIPINIVTLTFSPTKSISISENDFNRFLHELHPKLDHFTTKDLFTRRYLLEASRRDTLLADAVTVLNERADSDFPELEKRLFDQLRKFDMTEVTASSLTEEVRVNVAHSKEGEGIEQVKWAGYAIHPDYWRVRDAVAVKKKRKDVNTVKDSKFKTRPTDHISKYQYLHRARKASATKGAALMWVYRTAIWAVIFTALAALLGGAKAAQDAAKRAEARQQQQYIPHGTSETPSKMEHEGRGSIEKYLSKLMGKVMGNGGGGRDADDSMAEVQAITDDPSYVNTGSTGLYALSQAQAQTAFKIVDSKVQEKDLPVLFGIARFREVNIQITTRVDLRAGPGDFSVEALVPHYNERGIVPIIMPIGYRLVGLNLYGNGKPISRDDYWLGENPKTGATYVMIGLGSNNIAYTYNATYAAVTNHKFKDPKFEHLQAPILKRLNKLIADNGQIELSEKLNSILGKTNITLDDIEEAFYSTGYFTFSGRYDYVSNEAYLRNAQNLNFSFLLRDHVLHYQSKMANALMSEYLAQYYALANVDMNVQSVVGFFRAPGHLTISRANYNFTEVSRGDAEHVYKELDATPYRIDPAYQDYPELWKRMPVGADSEEKLALAQAREQKRMGDERAKAAAKAAEEAAEQKEQEERNKKYDKEHKNIPGQPFMPSKKRGLDVPEELLLHPEEKIVPDPLEVLRQKKMARLTLIRQQVHKAITEDASPLLKESGTPQMPGIKLLGFSRILLAHYSGKTDERSTVVELEAWQSNMGAVDKLSAEERELLNKDVDKKIAMAGSAKKAIESIFEENERTYREKLSRELKLMKEGRPPLYGYLLNPEIQGSLNLLATFMTKYLEAEQVAACDAGLNRQKAKTN